MDLYVLRAGAIVSSQTQGSTPSCPRVSFIAEPGTTYVIEVQGRPSTLDGLTYTIGVN